MTVTGRSKVKRQQGKEGGRVLGKQSGASQRKAMRQRPESARGCAGGVSAEKRQVQRPWGTSGSLGLGEGYLLRVDRVGADHRGPGGPLRRQYVRKMDL